jgi:hypothetical protein
MPRSLTQKIIDSHLEGRTDERPDVTTERPDVTTERPGVTTERPSQTATRPDVTTERPDATVERPGQEIGLRVDQTLTQDATGTMAYLQFEAIGVPRVRTELSVAYIDHNMLQTDFANADDHAYIASVA